MSILLTGGSGLLGAELQKLRNYLAPSHQEMDITDEISVRQYGAKHSLVSMIVHCAAFTDQDAAETQKELCYKTNVLGTLNLVRLGLPILFISSDSVFNGEKRNYKEDDFVDPLNYYCLTKALAEHIVMATNRHIILRCSFRQKPFEYPKACADKFLSGDYVEVIAQYVDEIVQVFHRYPNGVYHIGTKKTSLYDLAKQTRDVKSILLQDLNINLPKDVSLDLTKWQKYRRVR